MNLLAVDPITCSQEGRTRARRWLARTLQHPDTVILDTETVDLGAAVCEIAVIDTAGQVLLNTLVNPGMEHRINQEAQQIHGITMDELAAAPSTRTVLSQLVAITANSPHVMTYNADYDRRVITRDAIRAGVELDHLHDPDVWGCVMRARSSTEGHPTSFLPLNGGHRALNDCQATLALMRSLADVL